MNTDSQNALEFNIIDKFNQPIEKVARMVYEIICNQKIELKSNSLVLENEVNRLNMEKKIVLKLIMDILKLLKPLKENKINFLTYRLTKSINVSNDEREKMADECNIINSKVEESMRLRDILFAYKNGKYKWSSNTQHPMLIDTKLPLLFADPPILLSNAEDLINEFKNYHFLVNAKAVNNFLESRLTETQFEKVYNAIAQLPIQVERTM